MIKKSLGSGSFAITSSQRLHRSLLCTSSKTFLQRWHFSPGASFTTMPILVIDGAVCAFWYEKLESYVRLQIFSVPEAPEPFTNVAVPMYQNNRDYLTD